MDHLDTIIAYESGELSANDTLALFAYLIKTGLAWSLQGHYGRTASTFIELGYITPDGLVTPS